MKSKYLICVFVAAITLLFSCQFLQNATTFNKTSQRFLRHLVAEEYDEALDQFAIEHPGFATINIDTFKSSFPEIRNIIMNNFGGELSYSFAGASKTISTEASENTPESTTDFQLQLSNNKEFIIVTFLFDDVSKKIMNIQLGERKYPIPNMWLFWLLGLIAICIPIFNLYVLNLIRKSNLKRKWLKYIALFILNLPTMEYYAVTGFGFKLLNFQALFGIGFSAIGYFGSYWAIGIPLAGIYWYWRLKIKRNIPTDSPEKMKFNEDLLDQFETSEEE